MNTKAKGNQNEHRSIVLLEAAGYRCCRSASSLGCWDIVGVSGQGAALVRFPAPANALKLVHRWRDRQRMPDVREVA